MTAQLPDGMRQPAVLKANQFCVIGSEEKIEEDRDLFETVTKF